MVSAASMGSRQKLGVELRKLRLLADLSGRELASRIGISQARLSRIETAAFRPSPAVVRAWLAATSADPETRATLLELAEEAQVEVKTWRAVFQGSIAGRQFELMRQDAVASRVRHFQPFMVPGFLHTRAYAAAALRAVAIEPSQADVAAAVEARLERGRQLLHADRPAYHVILSELALRWRPLGVDDNEHRALLRNVLDAAENSPVEIRVVLADAPTAQASMSAFVIYDYTTGDPSTVDVELPGAELRFAGQEELAAWNRAWGLLAAATQDPEASTATVRRLMEK